MKLENNLNSKELLIYIENLIKEGKIELAINEMSLFEQDYPKISNKILAISARLNELKKIDSSGTISSSHFLEEKAKITQNLIQQVSNLKKKKDIPSYNPFTNWLFSLEYNIYEKITAVIGIIGLIIAVGQFSYWLFNKNFNPPSELYYFAIAANFVIVILVLLNPVKTEVTFSTKNKNKILEILNISISDLKEYYLRANNGLNEFYTYWSITWIIWCILYIVFAFRSIFPEENFIEPCMNIANNGSSLTLIYCVLTLFTRARNNDSTHVPHQIRWIGFYIIYSVVEVSIYIFNQELYGSLSSGFGILSGIAAAVVISLLIGRLDSKLIDAPLWFLILIYMYSSIQVFNHLSHIFLKTLIPQNFCYFQ